MNNLPEFGQPLSEDHLNFLKSFTKSCRHSIIEMVAGASSGHPGGSLSSVDYLAVLYAFILSQTGEKLVVSNGHISPAVYSVLAEMGYINKQEVVENFRKINTIYEGHITRHVRGIEYGTGPLGVGVSVGAAFAHAENLKETKRNAYAIMGDGETQEGQVHEMMNYASHYNLSNYILFIDYNKVQLTASIKDTLNINIPEIFKAGGWHVIDADAHNFNSIWLALCEAQQVHEKPVMILGHTIMGKGVEHMESDGNNFIPTWHGKAPKKEDIAEDIERLTLSDEEKSQVENFKSLIKWKPKEANLVDSLTPTEIETGEPITYTDDNLVDCRTAYGKALLDLAKHNKNIIALAADLKTSVMTKFVDQELPKQHIECGIAEQHMVSAAGGFSLHGFIPFCSTFGAFMSSRAKDQARVNDINKANVKMVSTHCGLSVGEDGPTHQAIDDMGSFLGMYNTMILEPADPNQTDHLIRYIASHYGNFYVRMGRHKFPILTKEDGSPFYDKDYKYEYGKTDTIRVGSDITIAASGAMISNAFFALETLKENGISAELVAVSSIKKFDKNLIDSIKKTKKLITIEDHNTRSGLGSQLARHLQSNSIQVEAFKMLGTEEYQLSGKSDQLYEKVGLSSDGIAKSTQEML